MTKRLLFFAAVACWATWGMAQNAPKLAVRPTGRILLDGALMDADKNNSQFNDGLTIADMRIGAVANYGAWTGKLDMSYAEGKVNVKDISIGYKFNPKHSLRFGYFLHQFGLQSITGASTKNTFEAPRSDQAFYGGRMLGGMYVFSDKKTYATLSLFAEGDAAKVPSEKLGNQANGVMSRLIYRPFTKTGALFHVGISCGFLSPTYNKVDSLNHHSYTLKTTFPTKVCNIDAQKALITDAKALWKFTPEIVAAYDRWGFEAQYYYLYAQRKDGFHAYHASGTYCNLKGLIKGGQYAYSNATAAIATPQPGAMELVLGYNYTDLSDNKAQILGGRLSDYSLTFNYYINKYVTWRVRGSYTKTTHRQGVADNQLGLLETRLQIQF